MTKLEFLHTMLWSWYQKQKSGARETAHWLKVLAAAFPGGSSSVPSTYIMVISSCLLPSSRVSDALFWFTQEMHPIYIHRHTHIHINLKKWLLKKYKTYLKNGKKKKTSHKQRQKHQNSIRCLVSNSKSQRSLELLHFKPRKQITANIAIPSKDIL